MAAVRVPPSACSTSQSSTMVFSPRALVSITARRLRPTSREISWVRPPMRALDRLAVGAGVGRARQHRVLRGHPALAAALAPARHALGERRRAQHPGPAELDEDAALGVVQPVAGDPDVAELVVGTAVVSGHAPKAMRCHDAARPGLQLVRRAGRGQLDLAGPDRSGLRTAHLRVVPRRQVGQHQPPHSPGVDRRARRAAAREVDPAPRRRGRPRRRRPRGPASASVAQRAERRRRRRCHRCRPACGRRPRPARRTPRPGG